MRLTLIGHSTILLEAAGRKILTDPFFGTWGNPAYARVRPPAWARERCLDVDLVLISHNHWDHNDRPFMRALSADVPVVAPSRVGWWTKLRGAKRLVGLRKWEGREFGPIRVTAVPALHMATTIGYVIEDGEVAAYFAGDTYHRPFMKEIGRRFRLDVALMPVTAYRIPLTMGEKGAVKAVRDLRPATVIPIHQGLQPRSPLLRTSQSAESFARRVRDAGLRVQVVTLNDGETWTSDAAASRAAGWPPSRLHVRPAAHDVPCTKTSR